MLIENFKLTTRVISMKSGLQTEEEFPVLFVSTLLGNESINEGCNDVDRRLEEEVNKSIDAFSIDMIPTIAQTSYKLMQLLMDEYAEADQLVAVIKKDPALMGRLLQLANSPFFRRGSRELTSIDDAVVLIGNVELRRLTLTTIMSDQFQIKSSYFQRFGSKIWAHSLDVAVMAEKYAAERSGNAFKAYFNGLIHDVGRLVIFRILIKVLQSLGADKQPSTGFLSSIIHQYGYHLTLSAIHAWDLDQELVKPILLYKSMQEMEEMDVETQGLFYANTVSEYMFLKQSGHVTDECLNEFLHSNGIDDQLLKELLAGLTEK